MKLKQAWGTVDKHKEYPYVDIFVNEQEAISEIGKERGDSLEIVGVLPGFVIVGKDGMCLDDSKDFYHSEIEAKTDMKRLWETSPDRFNTSRTLKSDGSEILTGDKLKGSQSAEVVVLWDHENQDYGVQGTGSPSVWLSLDQFLFAWGASVIRTGSILTRDKVIRSEFELS
jgi:hypothetical protein